MYPQFFGFSREPFPNTPDPWFFYFTETQKKAIDLILSGIKERKGGILISGEAGAGKTLLIHHLIRILGEKVKAVFIHYPQITFEELLKRIPLELDFLQADQGRASLVDQFHGCLNQKLNPEENLVIFIDEAQKLKNELLEELQALFALNSGLSPLQIIFVGQPDFEGRLKSSKFKQLHERIEIRCQISPLDKKETQEYIERRLNSVGSRNSDVFTPAALSLICRYAQGNPRNINFICENALWKGLQLSQKKIDETIVKAALKETFIQEPKTFCLQNLREKFFSKKISYTLLGTICLGLAIFLGGQSLKEKRRPTPMKEQAFIVKKAIPPPPMQDDLPLKNPPGSTLKNSGEPPITRLSSQEPPFPTPNRGTRIK